MLSSDRLCGYALRHAHSTFHPASRCLAGLVDLLLLTVASSVMMMGRCAYLAVAGSCVQVGGSHWLRSVTLQA